MEQPPSDHTVHLAITGLRCAGCVKRVSDALLATPGVRSAVVNLADRSAEITGTAEDAVLLATIRKTGYQAAVFHDPMAILQQLETDAEEEFAEKKQRTAAALIWGIPLMLGMGYMPMIHEAWNDERLLWLGVGVVTALVMAYAGRHFYLGAWKTLNSGTATMDTLIALGTLSAWSYSMLVLLLPQIFPHESRHLYFEAAIMIIALVNLGSTLESRARGKAQEAIRKLVQLQPVYATLVKESGDEQITCRAIRPGDVIRLRPGETVPVDGEIIEGHVSMEESMLTGESLPAEKSAGAVLHTGSRCLSGSAIFKASHIGADTTLSRIIARIREAQNARPPIASTIDRIASVFVPAVIVIAIITGLCWLLLGPAPVLSNALVTTVSVLIIACPCALGLAIPMSIMAGSSIASRQGILIRDGASLQMASRMTTLCFDKTGTLTESRASVSAIHSPVLGEHGLLVLAAALERGSEHPFAQAILEKAEAAQLPVPSCTGFFNINGKGLGGTVEGRPLLLGNAALMKDHGVLLQEMESIANDWASQGMTPLFLAENKQLAGMIGIADTIKANAKRDVGKLKQLGLRIILVSGDHPEKCLSVARELGISEVHGGMLPEEKLALVKRLQTEGETVGMVGDGINDAPALALADVGFAIGTGTDVAMASGGITLMQGDLDGIFKAIRISRATLRNIRQNLWGAFSYNSIAIPLAAGILFPVTGWLLNPMIASAAMAASSLTVVLNAGRLYRLQP